ncbi:BTB/POZ domain-containing protein 1-like isoform X2 [Sitodiplosis mosellana]|nr:BTB/POZ domain-containing protein 1-like isoform X2 [Sitodiplosis mosellana]
MFHGSLPEQGDIDLSASATPTEFKEFLQFFYLSDVKLTVANIGGVFDLVKCSMVDGFFVECEKFLIKNMTIENMCWGYQLAVLYEANELHRFCERAICMNPKAIFGSESFLNAPYELIHQIMSLNELLCDENDAIDGCIAWAQAACRRNQLNPNHAENLRNQLKEIVYQIRFVSINIKDFGSLLHKYPDLFTKEESQEIIFVMSHIKERTKFNRKPRIFQVPPDDQRLLCCNRFVKLELNVTEERYWTKRLESTIFSSNRPVLLKGFTYATRFGRVRITIREKQEERHFLPLFDSTQTIQHDVEPMPHDNTLVKAKFHTPIVIEPDVKYEIQLELEQATGYNRTLLLDKVLLNRNGIVIKFHPTEGEASATHGVIHRMYFSIFDKWSSHTATIFFRSSRIGSKRRMFFKTILMGTLTFLDWLNFFTSLIL